MTSLWPQSNAIALCRLLEPIAAAHGCHVALTGGTLYKDGARKDVDILLYRSLDEPPIDWEKLGTAFAGVDLKIIKDYGWCKKALFQGQFSVDLFDPHLGGGEGMSGSDVQDEKLDDFF